MTANPQFAIDAVKWNAPPPIAEVASATPVPAVPRAPSQEARVLCLRRPDAPDWVGEVYALVARSEPDEAIDVLFARVDDLLLRSDFQACDSLLRTIDLRRLDTDLILAVLAVTRAARERLSYRATLVQRARRLLTRMDPDRVDRLLDGLE